MPNRKLDIVRRLLPDWPGDDRPTEQHAMQTWWVNIRENGGMRLTQHGYDMLHRVFGMESWQLDLSDHGSSTAVHVRLDKRLILDLDRKLLWPYYLDFNARKKTRRVVFFGSQEAMMATLYGDLKQWLDTHD